MTHKSKELTMTDKSKKRAAEWAAEIPEEWTRNVERRVAEEIREWELAEAEQDAAVAKQRGQLH